MSGVSRRMITGPILIMVLSAVGVSAVAQIALKFGMIQPSVQLAIAGGEAMRIGTTVLLNPFVFGGLLLYAFSAFVWLFVLARLDLSIAYPFVSLGFVITMSLGCLLFNEPFTLRKALGTIVVMLGVYLVAAAR